MKALREIIRTLIKSLFGRGRMVSYAQDGEDAVLESLVKNKKDGVYVDVGTYHPIHYSNTYNLYKKGWKGIVIDPNTSLIPLYRFFRPRDVFENTGIAKESAQAPYYMFSDGAFNTFSETEAVRLKLKPYPKYVESREMTVRPLREILKKHALTDVDVLSVDVEGLDKEVLESHDWSVRPTIVIVEDNNFKPETPKESEIYQFLISKGYKLVANTGRTLFFMSA